MARKKSIIFLGDGMADEAVPELGGKTPLQFANTPAMDSIARDGCSGTLLTLPAGFPTGSEVANMSVLGCDLASEYCGRGPLEAAGRNVTLAADDKAFRLNLINLKDGMLRDYSGGHIDQASSVALIKELNVTFGGETIHFYPGVSYRTILVLSGPDFSHKVKTEKPDDNQGEYIADHMPSALEPDAEATSFFLRKLMKEAPAILEANPVNIKRAEQGQPMANGVWPWSGGQAGSLRTLKEKYGISSAVISAVDVIVGLGRCLGMHVITVPGATGYIDTNYEGKADAAIEALKTHDFVYLHLEAIDEVSHLKDLQSKIRAIENFDSRVVGRVLNAIGKDVNVAVLPDHPVPVAIGKHTRQAVPVAVRIVDRKPDSVQTFDEIACQNGSLGEMKNGELMDILLADR